MRKVLFIIGILAATLLLGAQSDVATLRTQSNLVIIPTRVQNKKGDTIYGLKADQFVVEDNGVRRAVLLDEDSDVAGLSLVVVIQCSGSAGQEFSKLSGIDTMVEAIVGEAPHEVAVIAYGGAPTLMGDFSSNNAKTQLALSRVTPCRDWGVATLDAVNYAAQLLNSRPNRYRRAVLLISETRDHGSRANSSTVAAALGAANTVVYSVAFSPSKDELLRELKKGADQPPDYQTPLVTAPASSESDSSADPSPEYNSVPGQAPLISILPPEFVLIVNALKKNVASELASLSGGEYIQFTTRKGFDADLQRLSNHVYNYYALTFKVPADAAPGYHALRVRVPELPNALIAARRMYWSGSTSTGHASGSRQDALPNP